MLTDGLQTLLPADSDLQSPIAAIEQTTTNMIREMRALLLELRPIQLDGLGLAAALEELAATYRARLEMIVMTSLVSVPLAANVEHTLLRVAQEALPNAAPPPRSTEIAPNPPPRHPP